MREYRLEAYPKRTKEGTHRDLSNCRLDFTLAERAFYAQRQAKKNTLIKESFDAWNERSCKPQKECIASLRLQRHQRPNCKEGKRCSWAEHLGISTLL